MAFETKELPADEKPKDTNASKAKPKADSKPKKDTTASKPKRGRPDLETKLNEFLGIAAVTACGIDMGDGIIIAARGEQLAHAWAELAKVNPNVDRVLRKMVEGGVWAGVVGSTLAVAVPIVQNHNATIARIPTPFGLTESDVEKAKESNEMIGMLVKMREEQAAATAAQQPTPAATNGG